YDAGDGVVRGGASDPDAQLAMSVDATCIDHGADPLDDRHGFTGHGRLEESMKPRLDRLPTVWPPAPPAPRQPSPTARARRARLLRQRRKAGVRCLPVEMSELDIQALAKTAPQADPAVERAVRGVLKASYGTHGRDRERAAAGPSEAPGG